ncbi:MAG: hypothetical protein AAFO04_24825 [Cyanobacteria bacterium J06592_8]
MYRSGLDSLYSSIVNTVDVSVFIGNVFNDPNNTFGGTPDEFYSIILSFKLLMLLSDKITSSATPNFQLFNFQILAFMRFDKRTESTAMLDF